GRPRRHKNTKDSLSTKRLRVLRVFVPSWEPGTCHCGAAAIVSSPPAGTMTRPLLLIASLWVLAAVALAVRPFRTPPPMAQSAALRWYKGNTHTHTLNSDGDSTPDEVARWYREHGYQFLVLTDHNVLTRVDGLNSILGADDQFLIVKGEEVSDRLDGKPIHIN